MVIQDLPTLEMLICLLSCFFHAMQYVHTLFVQYASNALLCNAWQDSVQKYNGTEDWWRSGEGSLPAWGILIDGQTSLDPAYIRNESLINKFHFSEKFLAFNFSNSKFIFLLLWAIERERCQMWHLRISPLTDFIAYTGQCSKKYKSKIWSLFHTAVTSL